jgi:hypothetical protein
MEDWLANPDNLKQTQEYLKNIEESGGKLEGLSEDDVKTLNIFVRTFECYQLPDDVKPIREATTKAESELEQGRNSKKWYVYQRSYDPSGK